MNQPPTSCQVIKGSYPPAAIICSALLIGGGAAITFASVLDEQTIQANGHWYAPYATISSILGLICATGIVMMRRWAVLLYAFIVVIFHGIQLFHGTRDITIFLLHAVILAVLFSHRSKMRPIWHESLPFIQEPEQDGGGNGG